MRATPISYGKEIYFEISRAIFLFAHGLAAVAPIEYPKSDRGAAFSDFLKFEMREFDVRAILRTLLALLQRRADPRPLPSRRSCITRTSRSGLHQSQEY
jgi:hypothetical protein